MAEKELLCQMLLDNSIIPSIRITADHFKDYQLKEAFKEIIFQYDRHGGATKECLIDKGAEYEWVMDIVNTIPTAANFEYFQKQIIDRFNSTFQDALLAEAEMIRGDGGDVLTFLEREITSHSTEHAEFETKSIGDIMLDALADIEKRYHLKGKIPGISTGIHMLDMSLGGWQKNFYYVIAARPSDGKSAELMNYAVDAAMAGKSVGFITAESANNELGRRMLARESRIDATNISLGTLRPTDFDALTASCERLAACNMIVYDEPTPLIEVVERKAREMKRRDKVDIIFLDYVQYLEGGEGFNHHEKIANISRRLKGLARRLNIPIVAAAQLKNYGNDRMPNKGDVAESDQILRDADGLIFIHHERNEMKEIEKSMLIVEKARDGKTGIIPVIFEGQYLNFKGIKDKYQS